MHSRTRLLSATLLCAVLSTTSHGFNLLEAWQAARQYDTGLAAAYADYQAGQEKSVQGRALWLPQVSLNGNYTHNQQNTQMLQNMPASTASGITHGLGVNLAQPLFDVSRYANYREGQIRQDLARITYESAQQQLMGEVASAYFAVLLAQDTLAATETAKHALATQLAQAKTAFAIGSATITDANEAQAGYDTALADEIQARSELEITQSTLTRLTGLSAREIRPLSGPIPLEPPQPDTLEAWLDRALANSLKIQARERARALAEQTLTARRGGHLPVIQLTAGYQDNHNNNPARIANGAARNQAATAGINLTVPLYAGGGTRSQVREAAALLNSARDQLEDARRQTREEVRRAWLGVTSGAASVRAQERRLISAKSKLESTRLGRDVGVRTNLDLLQAQQGYTDVLKDQANARYRYLNARLQLAQAAGTLDENTIREVNQLIGP